MEDFVTFEQAVQLKELGFDWQCNYWYHPLETEKIIECQTYCNHNSFERPYSAPTLSQAQKWLREKGIIILVLATSNLETGASYYYYIFKEKSLDDIEADAVYSTYEQALSAGIDKAIELLKEKAMETNVESVEKNRNTTPLIYTNFDYDKRVKLRLELEMLFNRLSIDNEMNMPDFILAEAVDNFIMTMYNTNRAICNLSNNRHHY